MSYDPLHEDRIQIDSDTGVDDYGDYFERFNIVDTNGQQTRVVATCPSASDAEVVAVALNMWYAAVPSFRRAYGV